MKRIALIFVLFLMAVGTCYGEPALEVEVDDWIAKWENTRAEILEAEFVNTVDGRAMIRVNVKYANHGSEGMYMLESFAVAAFQEDVQLVDCTDINGDPSSANLICEICDGESIEGSYGFELVDENDVRFVIYAPTADAEALAEKVFYIHSGL